MTFTSLTHNYHVVLILYLSIHEFFIHTLWTKEQRKVDQMSLEHSNLVWRCITILAMQRTLKVIETIMVFGG